MNKILIVGHPHSGHQEIEQMLASFGMATALPSKREGLMPVPLGALLHDAHQAPAVQGDPQDAPTSQIKVSPVWHGLALDLMLANVHQPLWGWSDPAAVQLLQFWHDIDPGIHFVMVYDTPGEVLASECQTVDLPSEWPQVEPVLNRQLRRWMHYHEALLQFYLRHTKRCLLVQRQQVGHAPGELLVHLQDRMPAHWTGQPYAVEPATVRSDTKDTRPTLMTRWVADAVAEHFPAATQLYGELQLAASLPRPSLNGTDPIGIWRVWNDLQAYIRSSDLQRQEIGGQGEQIGQLRSQLLVAEQHAATARADNLQQLACLMQAMQAADTDRQRLLRQLRQMAVIAGVRQHRIQRLGQQADLRQNALEQARTSAARQALVLRLLQQKRQQVEQRAEDQQVALDQARLHAIEQAQEAAALTQRLHASGQDREHLLSQLQQVQEALEHQHASQKHLSTQLAQLQQVEQLAAAHQQRIDQLLSERQQELARTQAHAADQARNQDALSKQLRTVEQAREQLLRQLQQVQETLAHQHAHQQQLAQRLEQLPRLEEIARERAVRIEQLDQQVSAQRHSIEQREAQAAALQTRLKEQAATSQSLAEDHARLVAQLQHVQLALARQPHAVAPAQSQTPDPLPPSVPVAAPVTAPTPARTDDFPLNALFGAADRVKAQLSYRLGATLIQHSRSLSGWLSMPFAVLGTIAQFQRAKLQRQAHKLPPIHHYRDAHEAERIRGHLSYRLGAVLIRHASSPLGWGRMPFAMQREIRAFRSGQKS